MRYLRYHWDEHTIAHLAANGVEPEEFVEIVEEPEIEHRDTDHAERLVGYGRTSTGKYLACVYTLLDVDDYVYPVTAMKSSPKRAKRRRPK
jgi:hypothetical protein